MGLLGWGSGPGLAGVWGARPHCIVAQCLLLYLPFGPSSPRTGDCNQTDKGVVEKGKGFSGEGTVTRPIGTLPMLAGRPALPCPEQEVTAARPRQSPRQAELSPL